MCGECEAVQGCALVECEAVQGCALVVRDFKTVAHLWGAWSIREGKFTAKPEMDDSGWMEYQAFLTQAEILRDWGQNWKQGYSKAKPPLHCEVWQAPDYWQPPVQRDDWPLFGAIPHMAVDPIFLEDLKPVTSS